MHIVLLCAARRGYQVAQRLFDIGASHRFTLFSFRETPWEPPFLDDLRQLTLARGHQFHEARNVAQEKWRNFWRENAPDLILMVSWRYLVPAEIYQRARLGAYVFHDSLLPRYRGFAPTVWAMINGESETGVTLFQVTDEMDAGDIVDQRALPIGADETIAVVMERVTGAYLDLIERNFDALLSGQVKLRPQDHADATYTCKWTPADGRIDWRRSARDIHNLVRATSRPYPGAYTTLDGRKLTIWSASLPASPRRYMSAVPGRVVDIQPGIGSAVLTGAGSLLLREVQLEGADAVDAASVLTSPAQTLGMEPG